MVGGSSARRPDPGEHVIFVNRTCGCKSSVTECDQRHRNVNTVNFKNVPGVEMLQHKGHKRQPTDYLFIYFVYFCSRAKATKGRATHINKYIRSGDPTGIAACQIGLLLGALCTTVPR